MPKVLIIKSKTPWNVFKPLKEGELYCPWCMQHSDCCKCLTIEETEVTQEEYDRLMKEQEYA